MRRRSLRNRPAPARNCAMYTSRPQIQTAAATVRMGEATGFKFDYSPERWRSKWTLAPPHSPTAWRRPPIVRAIPMGLVGSGRH